MEPQNLITWNLITERRRHLSVYRCAASLRSPVSESRLANMAVKLLWCGWEQLTAPLVCRYPGFSGLSW